jgi:hypothetical protein
LVKDKKDDPLADSHNVWIHGKNYFCLLLNVSRVSEVQQLEIHIQCDNLIPEMDTVCHRGDESANLCTQTSLGMFQRVSTWNTDQMGHPLPSSRGSSTCLRYTVGRKMSDKNLEQQINIKFCVKIGKVATASLVAVTISSVNWNRCPCSFSFKRGNEKKSHGVSSDEYGGRGRRLPAPCQQTQQQQQGRCCVATACSSCTKTQDAYGKGSPCSGACLESLLMGWIPCEQFWMSWKAVQALPCL